MKSASAFRCRHRSRRRRVTDVRRGGSQGGDKELMKETEREPLLRLVDSSRLMVRTWDEETVVYDVRSGETHVLDGAAATIFEWFRESPHTRTALLARIRATADTELRDPEFYLGHLLAEFARRQLLD